MIKSKQKKKTSSSESTITSTMCNVSQMCFQTKISATNSISGTPRSNVAASDVRKIPRKNVTTTNSNPIVREQH